MRHGRNGVAKRHELLLDTLRTQGALPLSELAERFSCSVATIRRDLAALEKETGVRRFRGAASYDGNSIKEVSFTQKASVNGVEKGAIARLVAESLQDGMTIGLNGGTTTTEVARQLVAYRRQVTVVTNAINIAHVLADGGINVVVIGGAVLTTNYETTGPMAMDALRGLHIDVMVLGANGVDVRFGITASKELEAAVGRAFVDRSDRVMVVADHTKLQCNAVFRMIEWSSVHQLATDRHSYEIIAQWGVGADTSVETDEAILFNLHN